MTRARQLWAYAAALALSGGGLPLACWSTRPHVQAAPVPAPAPASGPASAPEIHAEPARRPADSEPRSEELAPGVVKTRLLQGQHWVMGAVPLAAPGAKHASGTMALALRGWLLEVDIESAAVVRRVKAPYGDSGCRLATTPTGLAVTWRDDSEAKIAFLDARLEPYRVEGVGTGHVSEVSADGAHAVVVYDVLGAGFELVRFDVTTGQRVATRLHPGSITTWDEYPAGLVVKNDRIHVLVTRPNLEVRSYDLALAQTGVVRLPFPPRHDADIPPFGSLDAAGDDLLVSARGKAFLVEPKKRGLRPLPDLPPMTNQELIDVDASGRVLVDSGYLAAGVGTPFIRVVNTRTRPWEDNRSDYPVYVETPRAGFLWGARAVLVTTVPDVSLIRIDLERVLAGR